MDLKKEFGIGMWVYIMDINTTTGAQHTLWCKQNPNQKFKHEYLDQSHQFNMVNATNPGISLCLRFDKNKFFFTVKDGSTLQAQAALLFDTDGLDDVPISDMVPQLGWQYLFFNIYDDKNYTSFGGYYFTDREDHKSYNMTKRYPSVYKWVDDPLNYFTVGGIMATNTTINASHIVIYAKFQIFLCVSSNIFNIFRTQFRNIKVNDKFIVQQYEKSILGWYDFSPPKWTFWTYVLQDLGTFTRPLDPLSIDTYANEPTNGTEPIYVDRQGLYFDHIKFLRRQNFHFNNHPTLNNQNADIQSFTVETWIRFNYSTIIANNAYVVRKINGGHYFMMGFDAGPQAVMALNAIKMLMPVTVVNGSHIKNLRYL